MHRFLRSRRTAPIGAAIFAAALCAGAAFAQQPEPNSAGDIPDNQAFVTYRSPSGGYQLDVPEGWGRSVQGSDVEFRSKLDSVSVKLRRVADAPQQQALRTAAIDSCPANRKPAITEVRSMHVGSGSATLVRFTCRSVPDPVTDKSVVLGNEGYFFYRGGRLARVLLSAPTGADNADQWTRIVKSFRWL
jgi:hypothetical protein